MRKIRTTLLAIAVGCAAAPLAFAQSNTTPYGGSVNNNSNMGSSSTSRMDKSCAGLTGTALSRCEADQRARNRMDRESANADDRKAPGEPNARSDRAPGTGPSTGESPGGASGAGVGAGAGVGTGAGGAGTGGAGTGTR